MSVTKEGIRNLKRKVSPWEIQAVDWFSGAEELRSLAAQIINADLHSVAIVPSVSYGISIAAANLTVSKGQHIIVMNEEYPSNFYS